MVISYDTDGRPIYGVRLLDVDLSPYRGRRIRLEVNVEGREVITSGRVINKAQYYYVLLPTEISRRLGPKLGRRPSKHHVEVVIRGVL